MIERLPVCADDSDDTLTMGQFIDKINEVIEAVNGLEALIFGVRTDGTAAQPNYTAGPAKKTSGFRPLHIEDGQVKEAYPEPIAGIPDEVSVDEVIRNLISVARASASSGEVIIPASDLLRLAEHLRRSSVPEAEPQEQPPVVLFAAIQALEQAVVSMIGLSGQAFKDRYVRLTEARQGIIAAAHREYPQPIPQDLGLAFEKALNGLQNTVATLAVSKCMNTPAGFAEIAEYRQAVWLAAQLMKGV